MGIGGLSARHFYTSALNTADFLAEAHPTCTVFVIGESGLTTALHERRIANDSIKPDFVVVGEGQSTTDKLTKAHEFIEKGARLVATNPDNWCPISADRTRPGAGSTVAFLESSTGQRAYYLGKPNAYMFHRARKQLLQAFHPNLDQVVMIGDTMATDIRGAVEAGLLAYLVLSGSTQLEELQDYVYQPTRVLTTVGDLVGEIRQGFSANPDVYVAPPTLPVPKRRHVGRRHQTDPLPKTRLRPKAPMTK